MDTEDAGAADEARTALAAFLAGFGLDADRHGALVARLLKGACVDRRAQPEKGLGECAILHAEQQFEAWLEVVLGAEASAGQPALPIGRAAFLACDGPTAWPHVILVCDDLPQAFVAAMRAAAPLPSPMPTPGTMAPQPLDSWTIADATGAMLNALERASIARPLIMASIKLTRHP